MRSVVVEVVRDEQEWRLLAARVRPLVRTLVRDPDAADDLARDLDRALNLPSGPAAKRELRRALTRLPEIRDWLRTQAPGQEEGYRAAAAPTRFLEVSVAENVAVGQRVPLFARIVLRGSDGTTALRAIDVPPEGARVLICVWAPTVVVYGDMEYELTVPADRDSETVRFGLAAPAVGTHSVTVRVFRDGTLLGETSVRLSADVEVRPQEESARTAPITSMLAEPGEVTLQVERDVDHYRFQLLSEALHEPVVTPRLAADPREIVERLTKELGRMAAGRAAQDSPALVRRRLEGIGAELWGVVPEKVREQFWAYAGRISFFTVVSRLDVVPWELLFPVDGDRENGFLAKTVPIVRRAYEHRRARRLAMSRVAYVVPPADDVEGDAGCPAEIAAVRSRLDGIEREEVIDGADGLYGLVEADLEGIVHLAGHHGFSSETGSFLSLDGGELRPGDLEPAARRRPWTSGPLVFLNGCRTAGETPVISTNSGWAEKFLRIGAGAFIGSLWAVRSESAMRFADRFYAEFYQRGESFGRATLAARQEIMDEAGDPTWLAYTAHGNPAATVAGR